MPTIDVLRDRLFEMLEQKFTEEEFENLCFEFGIELDDVTSEKEMKSKAEGEERAEGLSEDVIYKIEIPANRYDLLCIEGLASALRIFLGKDKRTDFKITTPSDDKILKMTVKKETNQIRPFVVCAVLRDIKFDQARYESFIDLQDKLHTNICRQRTLVAIGTHDLDTLQPPFTYEALPPKDIVFKPLNETQAFNAEALFPYYEKKENCKLKPFLKIINKSPVYPVIYDSKRVVCSLPPIINGEHSKIKLTTQNVFIECTATDLTKANIVLNTVIAMFSRYCSKPFSVESIKVSYESKRLEPQIYPQMDPIKFTTDAKYINSRIGIEIKAKDMAKLLTRMSLPAKVIDESKGTLEVLAPPTRSDILHPCDIMEDVAIAYGYNNIAKLVPKTFTVAAQQPINKFTELLRGVLSQAGYMEVLTFALCAKKEIFDYIRTPDDGKTAITLSNPRVEGFNIMRTCLLPGLLKTISESAGYRKPIRIFEVSDICLLDNTTETGAKQRRHLSALWCDTKSGLENIQSLLRRVMDMNGVSFDSKNSGKGYYLKESSNPAYFQGRRADVYVDGKCIGTLGIVHPEVLDNFNVKSPCSAIELDIEGFC
mmetsp:Transcript_14943/g.23657  ORF Transcript_14943/g.23657 Transcript_14943/m.23657 type:complete len:598 (-) Transcript_14943:248-2041(-)